MPPISRADARRDILIDVSRLVWRWWRGGMPTGVDRVCLAYLHHFRDRSRAVVQWRGHHFVLSAARSDRLFDAFCRGPQAFRSRFAALAAGALLSRRSQPAPRGTLYLNVGHTGLNDPSLARWVRELGLKAVYFVHDLIPLTHPQYCRPGEVSKHAHRMETVLISASGVIANSQATLDELAAFAAERRLAMPPAVASFIAGSPAQARVQPTLLERPYFITVGTIEGRKNHILLLRVWERLVRRFGADAPLLVIVGRRGWEAADALAMLDGPARLKEHVRELGACHDDELASLIAGARALLMPSFTEGFGLPVAESLELGTPVIASNLPVYREFAGDVPTYLDPLDETAWGTAILSFACGCAERQRQLEAMSGFKPPSWKSHFAAVDEWLGTLLIGRSTR